MLHAGLFMARLSVDDFSRLPVDRPSCPFDHDIDSTRQLAETFPLPGIPVQALRVEQQCGVPVGLHMNVCSGGHSCNDFPGSRHLRAVEL